MDNNKQQNPELPIADVISRLSKLNRYNCNIQIDDDDSGGFLITEKATDGNYVKWSDIQKLLNDL